jgi:hypothetical protein
MKIIYAVFCALALMATSALADPASIYSADGKFLGTLGGRYEADSINNPYGKHGNRYNPDSVNNPYGQYGNRYSPDYVDLPEREDDGNADGDSNE